MFNESTNTLQKPWQTHIYWPYTHKSAQSIPTKQCFWNRPFRLPSFNSNWIQNGISKIKTKENCLERSREIERDRERDRER